MSDVSEQMFHKHLFSLSFWALWGALKTWIGKGISFPGQIENRIDPGMLKA